MKKKSIKLDKIELGVCYYPEQWDESLWEDDLNRMKKVGIGTVRIAEFAWSIVEPHEGEFVFGLFDRFLDLAEEIGIKVIFGTPTATPPAWLTEKYPEALNADIDGNLYRHGSRRHYNYNSPKYRELSARIVRVFAQHYASHPAIVGWQIDNELNESKNVFYSEADTVAFRKYLQNKYKTLDALNRAWGTVFWNQTYTAWSQVYVPRKTTNGAVNPHQEFDYIRFVANSVNEFVKLQADILREYIKPGDFITTNGLFSHIDLNRMTDDNLDFLSYDNYPNFSYSTDTRAGKHKAERGSWYPDRGVSESLTSMRSISPNFAVMEQQSSANGWNIWGLSPAPKPGQMTLWAMQTIAHGADYVSFFRWRTATFGTEIYWHGLLNYDNRDNRRIAELKNFHEMTKKIAPLAGSQYKASFAVLCDYDNVIDEEVDGWHGSVAWDSKNGIFRAAQFTHTPFDYLYISEKSTVDDLLEYPVLFYPHPFILTEETADLLGEYVSCGGKLIFGARTGYKDENGQCRMMPLPGFAGPLCGIDIKESTALAGGDAVVDVRMGDVTFPSGIYNDMITPLEGTEVLGVYDGAYYKGTPAFTKRCVGDGEVYYFGGTFREETARAILSYLGLTEPFADKIEIPECCEIAKRGDYIFVLNYAHEPVTVNVKSKLHDIIAEANVEGKITLPEFGVGIYKE